MDHLGGPGPAGGGHLAGTGCGKGVPSGVRLLHYLGVETVPVPVKLTYLHIAPGSWCKLHTEAVCLKINFKLQKSLDPFLQKRIMEYGLATLVPI